MHNLINFIPEQLLILVAVLSIIGKGCKKYKQLNNKYSSSVISTWDRIFYLDVRIKFYYSLTRCNLLGYINRYKSNLQTTKGGK